MTTHCSQESSSVERNIEVPEGGKLQYSNQTINVTLPTPEILIYRGIELLFIEDKLRGNSMYIDTGVEALCGYGKSIHINKSSIVEIEFN